MQCAYTAATYRGDRRENQDNMRVDAEAFVKTQKNVVRRGMYDDGKIHLFCVCDGIATGDDGAEAARLALRAVNQSLWVSAPEVTLRDLVLNAVDAAQKAVSEYFWERRGLGGTTICMAAVRQADYFFLNVGDSPGFLYRASESVCRELSQRHNIETRKREKGQDVLPGDASYLTAYVGEYRRDLREAAHTAEGCLSHGDSILLCSDGVSDACDLANLRDAMSRSISAADLAERASTRRGSDNCTAILLRFQEEDAARQPGTLRAFR